MQDTSELLNRFISVRHRTLEICEPLEYDDYLVQSADFVSPPKWHLAHTTWFFETLLLSRVSNYRWFHEDFKYLFNSYYKSIGKHLARPKRSSISRPTLKRVLEYRRYVEEAIVQLLQNELSAEAAATIELGIHHEEQHQELLLTDIKHILFQNPSPPTYIDRVVTHAELTPFKWVAFEGGVVSIGHEGDSFSFDNERPRHQAMLPPFYLANRPVTNGEYLEFVNAGGYSEPTLWLSDGWDWVERELWTAPLYWSKDSGNWKIFTLHGTIDLPLDEPVSHISGYEADAYARWKGMRLPTELEWEAAFSRQTLTGGGKTWEWTSSAYTAYPGFRPFAGAAGEYNGKFMCNQWVLRGGSGLTPKDHCRVTYRNFFHPHTRWQCSGLRLARDAK